MLRPGHAVKNYTTSAVLDSAEWKLVLCRTGQREVKTSAAPDKAESMPARQSAVNLALYKTALSQSIFNLFNFNLFNFNLFLN